MYISLLNPNNYVVWISRYPFIVQLLRLVQSVCLTVWTTSLALYSYSFDRLRCEPRKFLIQMSGAILNGEPRHVHRAERASAILLDYSRSVFNGAATQPQSCASKHEHDTSLNAQLYYVLDAKYDLFTTIINFLCWNINNIDLTSYYFITIM